MNTRFKQLREEMGLTQDGLKDRFNKKFNRNYTVSSISNFENNKRIPEIQALSEFADFFGVSIDYLIGKEDFSPTAEEVTMAYVVRSRRLQQKLTQTELGEKIGKSGQTISNIERGNIDWMRIEDIQNLAAALNITTDQLLGTPKTPKDEPRDLLDELFSNDPALLRQVKSVKIDGTIQDIDGSYQLSEEQKTFLRSSIKMALEAAKRNGSRVVEIHNKDLINNERSTSNQDAAPIVDSTNSNRT